MAYPTESAASTVDQIDRLAIEIKQFAIRNKDRLSAGNVPSTTIFDIGINLLSSRARLMELALVPGVKEAAAIQKNSPELDVTEEFPKMINAIDAVISWIVSNFPKDASGYLLAQTFGPTGPVDRQFTSASTAGLRTALTTLIATID